MNAWVMAGYRSRRHYTLVGMLTAHIMATRALICHVICYTGSSYSFVSTSSCKYNFSCARLTKILITTFHTSFYTNCIHLLVVVPVKHPSSYIPYFPPHRPSIPRCCSIDMIIADLSCLHCTQLFITLNILIPIQSRFLSFGRCPIDSLSLLP